MDFIIRDYQDSEKEILQNLLEELMDFVVATDPIHRLRRQDGYGAVAVDKLLEKITKQKGQIYLAELSGEVAGYVAGFPTIQTDENLLEIIPTKLGIVEDLYVREKFRGMNAGSALIAKMEAYLKEKGCDSLWIEVFTANTFAHDFYKRCGFIDREIGMLKELK